MTTQQSQPLNQSQGQSQGTGGQRQGMGQKKFAMGWKLGFFIGAGCVIASGVVCVIDLTLLEFSPFDFINAVYLLCFGLLMLIIDFPVPSNPKVQSYKLTIYKYFLFMTRFTGRGIWYLFLGTMIFASLWDLAICPFLGFILGGFVTLLGIGSIGYGITKSMKLEKVRAAILKRAGASPAYDMCPPQGFSPGAFNDMANSTIGIRFTDEELHYIFDALSFTVRADDIISKEEFAEWVRPGSKMLVL